MRVFLVGLLIVLVGRLVFSLLRNPAERAGQAEVSRAEVPHGMPERSGLNDVQQQHLRRFGVAIDIAVHIDSD